jgi:TRAP-type mannitol/chloroaromatic compound transport system substrate-binding protein
MTGDSRRTFLKTGLAAGVALPAIAAPAVVHAQAPIKWRVQCFWSSSEVTYKAFEQLCAGIGKLTQGRLTIEPFSGGAVTGVFESLDAVSAGVLQAQSSWPGYWTGKEPALSILGDLAFAYTDPMQMATWYYERGGLALLQEAYAKFNTHVVGVTWWGAESLVSKKPLNTIADFKGVKIRSPQGLTADIFTKIGASPVILPGGEVYSALDKGVVDAADWATVSMNQRMGLFEPAKYSVTIFHSLPVQEFSVNAAAWKQLPDDLKEIVTAAVHEWGWAQIRRVASEDARVAKDVKAKGVTQITWSGEELSKIRAIAQDSWKQFSTKSALAGKAYESQVSWMKELGLLA